MWRGRKDVPLRVGATPDRKGVSVSCSAREPKEIGEGGRTCLYGWRKLEQTRDAGELFRVREAQQENHQMSYVLVCNAPF